MKRLFFAIDLAAPVRDELDELQQKFEAQLDPGMRVRWTPRANLHLTVKFLGATEPDLVGSLTDLADDITADAAPFEMTTTTLGAFPRPNRPRILWAGVDTDSAERLSKIHRRLEDTLVEAPYKVDRDEHEFTAHITFGRVKSSRSPNLADLEDSLPDGPYGTTDVEALTLYESELTAEGAEYSVIHRSPLGKNS